MVIAKYLEIKTAAGQRAAFLSPKSDKIKDIYIDTRLNGESTLEFTIPANSAKLNELTPECQIWAGGRVYNLLKEDAIDNVRDEKNSLWAKYMAVERWAELDTQFPEPYITNDPLTPIPADLAVIIVGGGSDLSGGLYAVGSAAHAMYAILNGSGWTIGTVDVTGTHDLEMEKVSRLALIKEIQNIWGGYFVWDSVNKTVSLRSASTWINYTGFQVRYKKNLKNITRTQSNRLTTKLYAFGKDDLDIAAVNSGFKYVTNNTYTANVYTGIYRNPDIADATELKNKAIAELSLICHPKYLYRVKIADLRTLPEYSHEDFSIGDMADVIDPDVAPDSPRPRIIRHKYNLFQPWNCELELGDLEERLVESLKASFNTTNFINNIFNSSGNMSGSKLVDLSVTYAQLANASITTAKIANLAVDVTKLANLSVEAAKLADSAVTSTKIANAAVGSAAIANAAIGTAHIGTGVIITAHIGDAQIVTAKIGDLQVNNAKIFSLDATKITTGFLDAARIQTGSLIVGTNVSLGTAQSASQVTTIIGNTITTGYVNALNVTAGSVAAENITGTTITGKTIVGSVFRNADSSVEVSFSYGEFRVRETNDPNNNIFSVSKTGSTTYVSGDGNVNILTIAGASVAALNNWNFSSATVTGLSAYALANHNHSGVYAPANHTHDDRYYTETEADAKYVKTGQDLRIQYFSNHMEISINGGAYKVISYDP